MIFKNNRIFILVSDPNMLSKRCSLWSPLELKPMQTILIQHTDPSILDVMTLTLQDSYDVIGVTDIKTDLLDLIHQYSPIGVFLDFILHGEAAICWLKKIKQSYAQLPVITTSCNPAIAKIAPKCGFDGYLNQPFDLKDLLGLAHSLYRKAALSMA